VLRELGDLHTEDVTQAKAWIREFFGREYLRGERDPQMRGAIDTATVKRADALVRLALRLAVDDPAPEVRTDAVRGLKTLGDVASADIVIQRVSHETNWLARLEMIEYLGRIGTGPAVAALIPFVEHPHASARHKARTALARVAGQDLGIRTVTWEEWAKARFPEIRPPDAAKTTEVGKATATGPGAGAPALR
jgi:HEAT repeat protein